MNEQLEQCIDNGKVIEISYDPELIASELKEGKIDLDAAEKSIFEDNYKWAIIQAHFSIEHSFKALLFGKGFDVKGHRCLRSAVCKFFVDQGILEERLIKDFDYSLKVQKGEAQGYGDKEDFATYILNSAGEIHELARLLTEEIKKKI